MSALPTSNSVCVLFHTCTLTTYCKHMRERKKWERGQDSCMLQILLTGFFFSLSLRPSGCCISYKRKFQDPSLVITDSNSYVCPDETVFLGIFLLVLLNMSFHLPLLARLQYKALGILLNEDINFSRLLQTTRLLKKINCYCFCTAPFLGKMKLCHCASIA